MSLTLVHAREVACWAWHLRFLDDEPTRSGVCWSCQRDVAVPVSRDRERPICTYCGLDSGLLVAEDAPLGEPLRYAVQPQGAEP